MDSEKWAETRLYTIFPNLFIRKLIFPTYQNSENYNTKTSTPNLELDPGALI